LTEPKSSYLDVGGMKTHVLECGDGPPVVLLHSGEYGGCAEASWGHVMGPIADAGYRVYAPDLLGFGKSDKVIDFADPKGRRMRHIAGVLDVLGLTRPAIIGNSMGGTYLAQMLADEQPIIDAGVAVLVSAGGRVPFNAARKQILEYDLTEDSMRRIIRAMTHSPRLAEDEEYVRWRHQLSLEPGAWQCAESARLRPPGLRSEGEFGKPDGTQYERIAMPTYVIAGREDPLRDPGYAEELAARLPDVRLSIYSECGHLPNVEHPDRFVSDVTRFLDDRYRS
jgi:pimeloyl-ACP methyl ester carboxylesterase